jgi:hypothetical protein
MDGIRELILDFYESKSKGAMPKTKFSFRDIYNGVKKICADRDIDFEYSLRQFKEPIRKMADGGELADWSSGSSSYYYLTMPIKELRGRNLENRL